MDNVDIVTVEYPDEKGTQPFVWQHDSKRHEMEPGEVRPMQRYLYEHAHKLPNCPLALIENSMGPAQLAQHSKKLADRRVKELEAAAAKAVDELAAAKREAEAATAIAKSKAGPGVPKPKGE